MDSWLQLFLKDALAEMGFRDGRRLFTRSQKMKSSPMMMKRKMAERKQRCVFPQQQGNSTNFFWPWQIRVVWTPGVTHPPTKPPGVPKLEKKIWWGH